MKQSIASDQFCEFYTLVIPNLNYCCLSEEGLREQDFLHFISKYNLLLSELQNCLNVRNFSNIKVTIHTTPSVYK